MRVQVDLEGHWRERSFARREMQSIGFRIPGSRTF